MYQIWVENLQEQVMHKPNYTSSTWAKCYMMMKRHAWLCHRACWSRYNCCKPVVSRKPHDPASRVMMHVLWECPQALESGGPSSLQLLQCWSQMEPSVPPGKLLICSLWRGLGAMSCGKVHCRSGRSAVIWNLAAMLCCKKSKMALSSHHAWQSSGRDEGFLAGARGPEIGFPHRVGTAVRTASFTWIGWHCGEVCPSPHWVQTWKPTHKGWGQLWFSSGCTATENWASNFNCAGHGKDIEFTGLIALITVFSGATAPPPPLCHFIIYTCKIVHSARCHT